MRALVLGSAACVWDDLKAYGPVTDEIVVAVNDMIWAYPERIDHAVTLHVEHLKEWQEARRQKGGNDDYTVWSNNARRAVMERTVRNWGAGSSGMLGMVVALDGLGCDEVVLCGIPMDDRTHFFDRQRWRACGVHRKAWERNVGRMKGRVWSMSGWTRELLGYPPWLLDSRDAG